MQDNTVLQKKYVGCTENINGPLAAHRKWVEDHFALGRVGNGKTRTGL
jgi:hypothetical protein